MQLAIPRRSLPTPSRAAFASGLASFAIATASFIAASYVSGNHALVGGPGAASDSERAARALPFDAPLPYDIDMGHAGTGEDLPYRLEYASALSPTELSAQLRDHLAGSPKWGVTHTKSVPGGAEVTLVRTGADGLMTHFAIARITAAESGGSAFTFDFLPMWELKKAR